jgi:hypothetical protein
MAGDFEKHNLDWQIQQVQQQAGEWLERVFSGVNPQQQLPNWTPFDWLVQPLFWLVVLSLLTWTGWQIYQFLRPYWFASRNRVSDQAAASEKGLEVQTVDQWLRRSRQAQQRGDYREACRMLYLAMVQQLDDRQLIPASVSRTDGEYSYLVQTLDRPQPYQILIQAHEQACFGENPVSAELFDRCWQAYQEIQV